MYVYDITNCFMLVQVGGCSGGFQLEVYIFQNHAAYNGGGPMMGYCPGALFHLVT